MRLALWQDFSPMGNIGAAVTRITQAAQAAGAMGADMLVLPESFLPGYNHPDLAALALPGDDPALGQIATICRAAGCGVVLGYAERQGTRVYNTALAFDARGQILARYHKLQLYGPREKAIYTPGAAYETFDLNGQKAALLICYDVEFAPHIAALAAQGVRVILVPTANMDPFDHVVRHTVPAMAANYGVTIVYANYCGVEGDLTYVGGSLIAGPHGEILAQAGRQPTLLVADVPDQIGWRITTQAADFRAV